MKEVELTVVENLKITKDIYLMTLEGDLSAIKNPGEFVNLKLPNYYLRRPISVFDFDASHLKLLYKVLGHGTKDMSNYKSGFRLNVLTGLGNGFDPSLSQKPLLVAGGIGIAPLLCLAKEFNKKNIVPTLIFGAAKKEDIVLIEEIKKYADLIICTDDGSLGYKGNPIDYLNNNKVNFDYYYACGPQIMLINLQNYSKKGYLSLEARMGCGFGCCMGCSINTTNGVKRVCKEGPVFSADEVIF